MSRGSVRLLASALVALALLTGCWGRKELQELVFVTGIGVDWNKETELFDLTVEVVRMLFVPRPGEQPGANPRERPYYYVFVSGRTASEALLHLQRTRARQLQFTHLQTVIFGEEAARRGTGDMVDYLWRFYQTRPYIDMIVARGTARDLLAGVPVQGDITGRWLTFMLEQGRIHGYADVASLHRVMYAVVTPGIAPVVPVFALRPSGTTDPQNVPSLTEFRTDGIAVFRGDRLVRLLTPKESRGMFLARGDIRSTVITAPVPGQEGEWFSVSLQRPGARIEVGRATGGGLPQMRLRLSAEAEFEQRQRIPEPTSPEQLGRLEQVVERYIKEEVEAAIAASQEARADIIGFGEALRRSDPALFHRNASDWDDRYAELEVSVAVKVTIRRTGMMR
jgi:spore germination protein KC